MSPPAASVSSGGWEEEEEMFLLGIRPTETSESKISEIKDFARKDGCGFKMPSIFYQDVILKCSPTPHLDAACAAGTEHAWDTNPRTKPPKSSPKLEGREGLIKHSELGVISLKSSVQITPPVLKFLVLNAQPASLAFPGKEGIPSSSVHMCVCKESGEETIVGVCVGSHTGETRQNDTFLSLLPGSKGEVTRERTKNPCCCNGNVVLEGVGGCFQEMTGLTWVSTAAAHGNVCPHRGSACM